MIYNVKYRLGTYIAHPIWPEMNQIRTWSHLYKDSGFASFKKYLAHIGVKWEDFVETRSKSQQQFYRRDREDQKSEIIIPARQLQGAFMASLTMCPEPNLSKYAPALNEAVVFSDANTGKFSRDFSFRRFTWDKRRKQKKQRFQENDVIHNFSGEFTLNCLEDEFINSQNILSYNNIRAVLDFMFRHCGIGASRPLGYGRGELLSITPVSVTELV